MKPILIILAGVCAVSLHASQPEPKPSAKFKELDADGDRRVSLQEFTAPAVEQRPKAGVKASPSEEKPAAGDGIVSPANTVEGRYTPEVFRVLDVDHDQFLSPAELEALFGSAHNVSQP